ncbi:MAG: hypothetical protein KBF78_17250, partial [Fuscovulum sp.]|nr:hypothetical protein [Fuscovulum sp.]
MNLLPDITELSVDQIAVEARLRPFGMEPASASDVDHLSRIYARGLTLGPDLKAALLKASRGSIRNV